MLQTLQQFKLGQSEHRNKKKLLAAERAFLAVDFLRRFPGLTQAQAARLALSNTVYVRYALQASDADREAILSGTKRLIPPSVPTDTDLERIVATVGVARVWDVLVKNL